MGAVEHGSTVLKLCHEVNADRQQTGVEINTANVACQEQNPSERHYQTYVNNKAAVMAINRFDWISRMVSFVYRDGLYTEFSGE
jgi:hypothetical protein